METQKNWTAIAEKAVSILITTLNQTKPVPEKIAKYLNGCTPEEIRRYFIDYEKFDPLIVQVNEKMFVFDMKNFIEDQIKPLFEHTIIKLNSIQ